VTSKYSDEVATNLSSSSLPVILLKKGIQESFTLKMEKINIFEKNSIESEEKKRLRENLFLGIVFCKLLENMEASLEEAGYLETDEEHDRFMKKFSSLSFEDKKRLLSLPFELVERRFGIFRSQNTPIEFMIGRLIEEAISSGYTLGFHLSPFEIKIGQDKEWKIKGTEMDDRDEKKMAYYSTDYENLYHKGHQKYLYLIRAQLGENSAHGYDPSNHWGRATELSVVDRLDFEKVNEDLEKQIKEKESPQKS